MICNLAEKEKLGHSLNLINVNLEILGQLVVGMKRKTLNNVFRFQFTSETVESYRYFSNKNSHIYKHRFFCKSLSYSSSLHGSQVKNPPPLERLRNHYGINSELKRNKMLESKKDGQ